jgi:hypothetical protein
MAAVGAIAATSQYRLFAQSLGRCRALRARSGKSRSRSRRRIVGSFYRRGVAGPVRNA